MTINRNDNRETSKDQYDNLTNADPDPIRSLATRVPGFDAGLLVTRIGMPPDEVKRTLARLEELGYATATEEEARALL